MADHPTVVLKIGTSSLVDTRKGRASISTLARIAEVSTRLVNAGFHVIIVSSGAVGLGCGRMGLKTRPTTVAGKQAAAAVGQVRLMALYDDVFTVLGMTCAQVLLTYDSFGDRTQYLNARNTFNELLRLGVIPVVNENDTIATQEIRVGDNDTLSALVAAMVGAQWLMLLTDVEALYDANPRDVPSAAPIRVVPTQFIHSLRKQMSVGVPKLIAGPYAEQPATGSAAGDKTNGEGGGAGSQWGTGGMATKLKAAQLATAAGCSVLITCTANIERMEGILSAAMPAGPLIDGGGRAAAGGSRSRSTSPLRSSSKSQAADGQKSPGRISSSGAQADPAFAVATTPTSDVSGHASSNGSSTAATPAAQAPSHQQSVSPTIFVDASMGTTFLPAPKPVTGRKRWILSLAPQGTLVIDAGAVAAVRDQRKSLFPAGVKSVAGDFDGQDAVVLTSEDGSEVARALVNYSSDECRQLQGKRSKEITDVLGFLGAEALADRDNIVILHGDGRAQGAPDATPERH